MLNYIVINHLAYEVVDGNAEVGTLYADISSNFCESVHKVDSQVYADYMNRPDIRKSWIKLQPTERTQDCKLYRTINHNSNPILVAANSEDFAKFLLHQSDKIKDSDIVGGINLVELELINNVIKLCTT